MLLQFSGYYCSLGAYESSPTDNTTGHICPMGHYCPTGSSAPTACDLGYYLDAYGSTAITNCKICEEGQYCGSQGLPSPSGDCDPGYYCPEGQDTATPSNYTCTLGHYCLQGVGYPTPCASGTYQVSLFETIYIMSNPDPHCFSLFL